VEGHGASRALSLGTRPSRAPPHGRPLRHPTFAVSLGAASCPGDAPRRATLWHPAGGPLARPSLLMPALTLPVRAPPSRGGHRVRDALLPRRRARAFGCPRAPNCRGGPARGSPMPARARVSCYAFFKGWLPPSLPPPTQCGPPPLEQDIERLRRRSGLSPSRRGTFARPRLRRPPPPRLRQLKRPRIPSAKAAYPRRGPGPRY